MDHSENPNPNFGGYFPHNNFIDHNQSSEFEVSDCLIFDEEHLGFGHHHHEDSNSSQSMVSAEMIMDRPSSGATSENCNMKCKNVVKKMKTEGIQKVAFRTQSELEIMDDGYKWRKYGKKSVKNSPNPRNYYKCSTGGCQVKKRVERDREDSSYVLTTYEGVHNHESPCIVYDYNYNHFHHQDHQTAQNCWSLQASSSPPSSSSS